MRKLFSIGALLVVVAALAIDTAQAELQQSRCMPCEEKERFAAAQYEAAMRKAEERQERNRKLLEQLPDEYRERLYQQRAQPRRPKTSNRSESSDKAKIVSKSFKRVGNSRGHWRGRVRGTGTVKLYLKIFEAGRLVDKLFMGRVNLSDSDGSVLFSFLSELPKSRSWSWSIESV